MSARRARVIAAVETSLAALIGVVYLASIWIGGVSYSARCGRGEWTADLSYGAFTVFRNPSQNWGSYGFRLSRNPPLVEWAPRYDNWSGCWRLTIPLWVPLLIVAAPAAVAARRRPLGGCRRCGYDLRGTPGAVCPECGKERAA